MKHLGLQFKSVLCHGGADIGVGMAGDCEQKIVRMRTHIERDQETHMGQRLR